MFAQPLALIIYLSYIFFKIWILHLSFAEGATLFSFMHHVPDVVHEREQSSVKGAESVVNLNGFFFAAHSEPLQIFTNLFHFCYHPLAYIVTLKTHIRLGYYTVVKIPWKEIKKDWYAAVTFRVA